LERAYALMDGPPGVRSVPDARHYQVRAAAWEKKARSAATRGERARFTKLKEAALDLARKLAAKQRLH
jgi:hypothetical protein